MKKQFTTKYKDNNDGAVTKEVIKVSITDLTKDLGGKFLFIDSEHHYDGHVIRQDMSLPLKDLPKLIKLLKEVK